MPDYTRMPIMADVLPFLVRAHVTQRYTYADSVLNAVIREVERRTLRQFVPDAVDTTRVYDGNGSAELEVDEIVSLTSVTVIGYQSAPGYTLANVQIVSELHKPQTRLVVARGSLPALVGEGFIAPYPTQFPAGRQNIQVQGRFGFGLTVPEDLWNGVCGEVAWRLAAEATFNEKGRVLEDRRGDTLKKFGPNDPTVIGWHDTFERLMGPAPLGYKRPSGRRLRNLRGRPIG